MYKIYIFVDATPLLYLASHFWKHFENGITRKVETN